MKYHKPPRVPIRVNKKIVGYVERDTFYKNLRASAHFLRVPRAIAFDTATLEDAARAGARYVQVRDIETGRVFRQSIATIRARGFRVARGFGEQIALALELWSRDDETIATQLSLLERATR